MTSPRTLCAWTIFCVVGLLLIPAIPVSAATFAVDTTADTVDDDIGDSFCADVDGNCSLRAAVQEANFDGEADIIELPAGTYALTIDGAGEDASATGDLDLETDITILGDAANTTIINASAIGDRVLHIDVDAEEVVSISNTTVTGGHLGAEDTSGGGILAVGDGTLQLKSCAITNNISDRTGATTIPGGGGLAVVDATCGMTGTTISGNETTAVGGGGISNDEGTIDIFNSTISSNTAATGGGGIYNFGGTITLDFVTVADNVADGGDGGGLLLVDAITLKNTLIAGNSASSSGPDCSGAMDSEGFNLIQDDSDCDVGGELEGMVVGEDPLLGDLADNGGTTETHAILAGSPAIDTADPECEDSDEAVVTTDQRAVDRPLDPDGDDVADCDIGAFEASCGDGEVQSVEECDDSNTEDDDGCSSLCQDESEDEDGDGEAADEDSGGGSCSLTRGHRQPQNLAMLILGPVMVLLLRRWPQNRSPVTK